MGSQLRKLPRATRLQVQAKVQYDVMQARIAALR